VSFRRASLPEESAFFLSPAKKQIPRFGRDDNKIPFSQPLQPVGFARAKVKSHRLKSVLHFSDILVVSRTSRLHSPSKDRSEETTR
jgi:hypothetical protein